MADTLNRWGTAPVCQTCGCSPCGCVDRRASSPAAVPEGALPPLPEPKVFVKRSEWHDALTKRQSFNGWRVNYGDCDMNLYTVEQVRDAPACCCRSGSSATRRAGVSGAAI